MSNYVAYSRDEIIMENYSNISDDVTKLKNLVKERANNTLSIDDNAKSNKNLLKMINDQYADNEKTKAKDTGVMDVMVDDNIKINRNQQLVTSLGMITAATLIVFAFFRK
jgi:hypothetical protein